jgi:hypothetical protein
MNAATLPDARVDLLGAIDYVVKQTAKNAEEIKRLQDAVGIKKVFGISDLAKRWGVSESSIRSDPVKQPNYGLPDIGIGFKRWFRETVESWESCTEEERRDGWERMTEAERRRFLGTLRRAAS